MTSVQTRPRFKENCVEEKDPSPKNCTRKAGEYDQSRNPIESIRNEQDNLGDRSKPPPSSYSIISSKTHPSENEQKLEDSKDELEEIPPTPTPSPYRLFLGIAISLFFLRAFWRQRVELQALKKSQPLPMPHPITPITTTFDDDVKHLLDELEEQESKWMKDLSHKTSQIEILRRDNAYLQRKFNDLQKKYNKDAISARDRMDAVHTQCYGWSQSNEALRRRLANSSQNDRKLNLLRLLLHLMHMERKECRREAKDTEDEVLFLYSQLEQSVSNSKVLKEDLRIMDEQKQDLIKVSRQNESELNRSKSLLHLTQMDLKECRMDAEALAHEVQLLHSQPEQLVGNAKVIKEGLRIVDTQKQGLIQVSRQNKSELYLSRLLLHLTQMDRKECKINADATEHEVLFLYSQLRQSVSNIRALEAKLKKLDA